MQKLFDKEHTYKQAFAMCDYHSEILGFFSTASVTDSGFFLSCYSTAGRKGKEFYLATPMAADLFADAIAVNDANDCTVLRDEEDERLSISHTDDNYCIIQLLSKRYKVVWEVILSSKVAEDFSKEIKDIVVAVTGEKAAAR